MVSRSLSMIVGCISVLASLPLAATVRSSVLLIIADDLGVDMLGSYGLGEDLPTTPNLDALAANGVVLRNVWSDPICSPTRATINTGRYGFRNGVQRLVSATKTTHLPVDEILLPELLDLAGPRVEHALVGKWHLGNCLNGGDLGPNLAGYGHYGAGSLLGLGISSYSNWRRTDDGVSTWTTEYATTAQVDAAIEWLADRRGRWFLNLAFVAPHSPWEVPPHALVSAATLSRLQDEEGNPLAAGTPCTEALERPCYVATIEAMDSELGRLLAATPPEATVIFVGDNGTPEEVTVPPFQPEHAKGTLYEGGIRVPLIVSGPTVVDPGRESLHLVNTSDLFSTVAHLTTGHEARRILFDAGFGNVTLDSESLLPILQDAAYDARTHAFSATDEAYHGAGNAIRNDRYKLISRSGGEELYDLIEDPMELTDLLAGPLDPSADLQLRGLRRQRFTLLLPHYDDCPTEVQCAECNDCLPTAACTQRSLGTDWCRLRDGSTFSCASDQTVQVRKCGCESPSLGVCTKSDLVLVCE